MLIAPEGYIIIAYTTILALVLGLTGQSFLIGLGIVTWIFVLSFFRDPKRQIARKDNTLYAAADGLITEIREETFEGKEYYRIVTFLSVFNCHVNRIPYKGTVLKTTHFPGKFLAAYKGDLENKNERQETILDTDKGRISVVQITGAIARRILCHLSPEQTVTTGERFGLIRFGSRTDVVFPKTATILIKKGQMVKGGITEIASW